MSAEPEPLLDEQPWRKSNITHSRRGMLEVLGLSDKQDKKNNALLWVKCDCGNIIEITRDTFYHRKHCGCKAYVRKNRPAEIIPFPFDAFGQALAKAKEQEQAV